MFELLLAFAFWPWVIFILFISCLTMSVWFEETIIAALSLIVYAGLSLWLFGVFPLAWTAETPLYALALIILYCACGMGWSLFKWARHIKSPDIQGRIKSAKLTWSANNPENDPEDFYESAFMIGDAMPSTQKGRIINWIALWPFSLFGFVFKDLVLELFDRLYEMMGKSYERITKSYMP